MPLTDRTIATIGSGVMAEAMIAGLLRGGQVTPDHIVASHPRADRREVLERDYGIRVAASNEEAVARQKPALHHNRLAFERGVALSRGRLFVHDASPPLIGSLALGKTLHMSKKRGKRRLLVALPVAPSSRPLRLLLEIVCAYYGRQRLIVLQGMERR
jgi:hypothetical protein